MLCCCCGGTFTFPHHPIANTPVSTLNEKKEITEAVNSRVEGPHICLCLFCLCVRCFLNLLHKKIIIIIIVSSSAQPSHTLLLSLFFTPLSPLSPSRFNRDGRVRVWNTLPPLTRDPKDTHPTRLARRTPLWADYPARRRCV